MGDFKGTPGPWIKEVRKSSIVAVIPMRVGKTRIIEVVLKTGYISSDDCGQTTCCCVQEHANAQLIAAAPDLLEALQEAKQLICSLKLSMLAHPDCTEGSEFEDYTSTAQEFEDKAETVINKALGEV